MKMTVSSLWKRVGIHIIPQCIAVYQEFVRPHSIFRVSNSISNIISQLQATSHTPLTAYPLDSPTINPTQECVAGFDISLIQSSKISKCVSRTSELPPVVVCHNHYCLYLNSTWVSMTCIYFGQVNGTFGQVIFTIHGFWKTRRLNLKFLSLPV